VKLRPAGPCASSPTGRPKRTGPTKGRAGEPNHRLRYFVSSEKGDFMFDSIAGLPLHALVIHVVVVAIPLATLLALLFAFPRTRNWARWPLGLVALGAAAATFVARQSGPALQRALNIGPGSPVGVLITRHQQLANQLFIIMIVFAVVAVASSFLVTRRTTSGGSASSVAGPQRVINIALPIALVIVALIAAVQVYRVGDLGARAVWNPTGTQSYNSGG
jgi:hypothetical protein